MKRLLIVLMLFALCTYLFTGCGAPVEDQTPGSVNSMFICVEKSAAWWVVYHKDTKVMYTISAGHYNCGTFTVMLNPDGTPMIWEGE